LKFVHTADTHLGFHISKSPVSHPEGRRKRSQSIFENFLSVAEYALETEVDLFIHSGDLFNKYYIERETVDELIRPLVNLSKAGIPILVIPGNHERSQFPFDLFHGLSNVFVCDHPKCVCLHLGGYAVGIAGFPFIREDSKRIFQGVLEETGYREQRSDFNLLVTHQAFDGAVVGPSDFVFGAKRRDTVLRCTCPTDFEYIAAGHIHRYQVLPHPLKPRLKIVYPGSIQRMSYAEMYEEKGFVFGELLHDRIETSFIPLPVYEMEIVEIEAGGLTSQQCEDAIVAQSWRFDENRVMRFNLVGGERTSDYPDLDLEKIRSKLPLALECQFAVRAGNRWIIK
jgi:exonuclease SbcD